ncbi:winged helix-turn-helix domain-containing protein [Dermatobacter hominis]|uniref:winged helix-turn-helix domain-containing protein n=1 Tax=Dermatobacter hominis TaxID=2884263 RepID=UPI001D1224A0|nr:winged helix-turn-helix domain-containing protein [Dermatobacter hominis]UDY37088.1 winged helix-turn-helix domain-containing protein [Dermatobacter hominis]
MTGASVSVGSPPRAVALVRWPEQTDRRAALCSEARPRLLLLEADDPPPEPLDDLEDWVRLPVSDADLRSRAEWLLRRAPLPGRPVLDDDGVLHSGDQHLALPPIEARMTGVLLERFGAVASRESVVRAAWPDAAPGRNALDVHILRLRRRLEPVGLAVRTVRNRGYRLEPVATPDGPRS